MYMMIRIDDHTDKHWAKGLRIGAQRTTAKIPVDEVEKLLSCVLFLLSTIEE
jgi:hypothetical protein